jgi:FkbM family methyltransferase
MNHKGSTSKDRRSRPLVISDIPVLRHFFRKSTWRDASVRWFFGISLTGFFWRRILLSSRDAILNKYFGYCMGRFSQIHQGFTFIYIGANDGIIGDTIMPYALKYRWRGILVEPVPHIMKKLKRNFGHYSQLAFEQVAIDIINGKRTLYTVRESDSPKPALAQLIHSFSRDLIMGQEISWGFDPEVDVKPVEVKTVTLDVLLKEHAIASPQLIVMDIEGYDFAILEYINSKAIYPAFLKFEHLNMSQSQQKEIKDTLRSKGYRITKMRADYFCRLKAVTSKSLIMGRQTQSL